MLLCVTNGLLAAFTLLLFFFLANVCLTVLLFFDGLFNNRTFAALAAATMGIEVVWGLFTFGPLWPLLLWPATLLARCVWPYVFRARPLWVPPPDPPPIPGGPYR